MIYIEITDCTKKPEANQYDTSFFPPKRTDGYLVDNVNTHLHPGFNCFKKY